MEIMGRSDTGEKEVCQDTGVIRYITYNTLHASPDITPEERNIISTYQDMLAKGGRVFYNCIVLKISDPRVEDKQG